MKVLEIFVLDNLSKKILPNIWKQSKGGNTFGVVVFGGRGLVPSFMLLKHGLSFDSNIKALSV